MLDARADSPGVSMSDRMAMIYQMSADDAARLCRLFDEAGLVVWIDGGWAVDALLGRQTRPHEDLDIAIQEVDLATLRLVLSKEGYRDIERDDTRDWNFVLGDDHGRSVDVHAVWFDPDGVPMYGPAGSAVVYPALTGSGAIGGYPVRCTAAESLVAYRTGFKLRDRDYHDVAALCDRFAIDYPDEYLTPRPR